MPETAKIQNSSGESLIVPWLGGRLVEDKQVVDVPVDDVYAYTHQAQTWSPHDAAAKKAHKAGADARDEREAAEAALYEAQFGTPAPETPPDDPPAPSPAVPAQPQED